MVVVAVVVAAVEVVAEEVVAEVWARSSLTTRLQ